MAGNKPIDKFRRATARRLRGNATNAEVLLWQLLRRLETQGTHFRRQVPIGPFVADFACLAARLVIELDGSHHGLDSNREKDAQRTRWLESEGYRVIRFWNNEVLQSPNVVLEAIYAAVHGAREAEPRPFRHERQVRSAIIHPTPARSARRPSPSRGG